MTRIVIKTLGCFVLCATLAGNVAEAQPHGARPRGPRPMPGRGPVVINNYSNNNSGLVASALGFGAGMLIGSATAQPPAPRTSTVIVTQPINTPVIVAHPTPSVIVTQPINTPVIVAHPTPSVTTVVAQPAVVDAVSEALKMLNSHWASKRRDGCMMLGRHKARQGVGPLLDLLRNDKSEDVRKSAAWALAEIGDSIALDYLTKASQFDRSPEVQAAASTAYQRLVDKVAVVVPNETSLRSDPQKVPSSRLNQAPPLPPVPGQSPPISNEKRATGITTQTPSVNALSPATSPFAASNPVQTNSYQNLPPALVPPNEPLDIP
jgi:hypothetical protein